MPAPKWQRWKVVRITKETPDTSTFRLEPIESKSISFKPGQFVNLILLDEKSGVKGARPYSIASSPLDTKGIELTIKLSGGQFTGQLSGLKEGAVVGLMGPFGSFTYDDKVKDVVILTGGVGITPFRSFWKYVTDKGTNTNVTIIYSCRTPNDVIYKKELEGLSMRNPLINVTLTYTREVPPNWTGMRGRIDIGMVKKVVGPLMGNDYYVCGPAVMVIELEKALIDAGVDTSRIHAEKWG
jgi:ferredoxin-NADP reductase